MTKGKCFYIAMALIGVLLLHIQPVAGVELPDSEASKSLHQPTGRPVMARPVKPAPAAPASIAESKRAATPGITEEASPQSGADAVKAKEAGDARGGQGETSALERAVLESGKDAASPQPQPHLTTSLVQFGYNFFRSTAAGFAPLSDVPVGDDYVVAPGDRIVVHLWGSIEGTHELEVNRGGEIFLPRVGGIKVWGVSFGNLKEIIRGKMARVYRDFDLNVAMGKLRVMKVFVVGEVRVPGDYNLNPLSTLINALSAAGGPLKTGTLRNVQVKRRGVVVETVDLYDFFLKGDKSKDIRLQPGDTIFVPVIGRVASVAGNVKRPAIYELREEKNLGDLVVLAGGFLPTGYLQRVQIGRIQAHEKKAVTDFNVDPRDMGGSLEQVLAAIPIQDMDIVKVFPIAVTLRDHVRLSGYVLRPGDYALKPGMRLSELVAQGNLLPEYYRDAAEITRLYPPDYHPEIIFANLAAATAGVPNQDLELKEFDTVRVFSRWEMEEMPKVRVNGEVQRPGEYRLFDNMTVRDLLLAAGNLKMTAYTKNAEINRLKQSGEEAVSYPLTVNLADAVKGSPDHNLKLQPRDELIVRRIPNWAEETERYVTLKGEFRFPGVYPIYKGEKLSAVIERGGGYTDKAYLRAARFTRTSIRELQQKRMDEVIAKTEQQILSKQTEVGQVAASKEELEATKFAITGLQRSVSLLKEAKAEGRLVIRLDALDKFRNSAYDVEVAGGDELEVPKMPNAVTVLGHVYNPTSLIPVKDESVGFYLAKAGGPTREAEEDEIYIVRADGTVLSRQQVSMLKSLFFSGFMSNTLYPGDTVIVPQRLEKIAWMREIKDITSILSQVALTAGVLIAAGL